MIAIVLNGGLGNLLFEYAFIYSLHKRLNTPFLLIKHGDPILLYRYFNVERNTLYYIDKFFFNHSGYKLFFSHYLRKIFISLIGNLTIKQKVVINNKDNPDSVLIEVKNHTTYEGYFQSELYFKLHSQEIKTLLRLKKKYIKDFEKRFNWIKKYRQIVTIHIRRTDYQDSFSYLDLGGKNLSLPISYYREVIKKIDHPDNFYILISDDVEAIKGEFDGLTNKYFSKESEIIDFQFMLNADICVIANSSFSWWAAYLNSKDNIVYCPKYYLGFLKRVEYPKEIYPENWIQIPI
ncbi:alpha-1,2-fucosyltransferase [Pedobacter mucosus]|uniref:alpha-1,2-fucosyltransferase n=1 Tax=Pedobacter mucosus TaxID=2895286 RepID=UPI001EE48061|nr:alpha-1,2-fucosyltransferase [Pedobacter mucosus]UKT64394.1 alpha-1,2-fucosyltransferase [Pedobacter mucosus]